MGELFSNFLAQMVMTIGMIILFGFLIATFNKMFYRNFGSNALTVCYVTGAIGTPVHELAHALMCVIFRHRIDEIKLFQISSDDGTLGYVAHSWNPKNLYQSAGNFFIGHSDGAKTFDTTYRSIRFYDRALTAEEVLANAKVDGFGN